ncbi:MAG TPA: O-antigen ligase family protein [Vicinamibacterales bacterium]|nr:O-antigen ligase family protein [Vicinamibacterales bacterium]
MTLAGVWFFLAGLLFMITGDGPTATVTPVRWLTPFPFLAWPWLYLVFLGLGAACIVAGGAVKSWKLPHLRFLVTPLAALLGAFLLSAITSEFHRLSAVALLSVIGIVCACWIFALLLEDERVSRAIWPITAVALLLLAVRVILWRRDEGLNVVAFQVINNAWLGKLQLAWVFNLLAPLLLARSLGEPRKRLAILYGITWAITGIATYLLFSRMGTIAFGVATLGVWIFNPAHWRKGLLILIVGAIIGAGLAARSERMARYLISTIIEPDRNPGVGMRLSAWRDAVQLFRSRPITGTGLGTYDEVSYRLETTTADPFFRQQGWHAHNVYLHLLAETGILGLLAWSYFWYAIIARLVRAWKRADARDRLTVAGALWSVLAFLVLSISEVLIGARVHASLRMNLTIGLVVVWGLYLAARARRSALSLPSAHGSAG